MKRLSRSLHCTPSPSSSSSLIFALNISQRTGSGRVTYCSSTLGSLSRWRRRRRRRFVRPFSAVAPATSIKEEERRGEKRRRRAVGRETEEYGRVQLNGKKDEDETRGTSTGMMFRFWREGEIQRMSSAQSDCRRGRDEWGDFTLVTLLGREETGVNSA